MDLYLSKEKSDTLKLTIGYTVLIEQRKRLLDTSNLIDY